MNILKFSEWKRVNEGYYYLPDELTSFYERYESVMHTFEDKMGIPEDFWEEIDNAGKLQEANDELDELASRTWDDLYIGRPFDKDLDDYPKTEEYKEIYDREWARLNAEEKKKRETYQASRGKLKLLARSHTTLQNIVDRALVKNMFEKKPVVLEKFYQKWMETYIDRRGTRLSKNAGII
jgi:hypothetical protein